MDGLVLLEVKAFSGGLLHGCFVVGLLMVLARRSRACANPAAPRASQNCHRLCFFWIGGVGVAGTRSLPPVWR